MKTISATPGFAVVLLAALLAAGSVRGQGLGSRINSATGLPVGGPAFNSAPDPVSARPGELTPSSAIQDASAVEQKVHPLIFARQCFGAERGMTNPLARLPLNPLPDQAQFAKDETA